MSAKSKKTEVCLEILTLLESQLLTLSQRLASVLRDVESDLRILSISPYSADSELKARLTRLSKNVLKNYQDCAKIHSQTIMDCKLIFQNVQQTAAFSGDIKGLDLASESRSAMHQFNELSMVIDIVKTKQIKRSSAINTKLFLLVNFTPGSKHYFDAVESLIEMIGEYKLEAAEGLFCIKRLTITLKTSLTQLDD